MALRASMLRHKAFCAAVRPVRVQRWPIRCRAAPAADPSLLERLQQAETSADWATALEVVTEAKVLKLQMPVEASECAVRVFSQPETKQWKRAIDVFQQMLEKKHQPSPATSQALFQALVKNQQGSVAMELLQSLKQAGIATSPLHNMTVRALVKEGRVDDAIQLLDAMVLSDGAIVPEAATFTSVAGELLRMGEDARAEEVLEMRDYL